jgi:pyruvate, water dikinase
VHPGDILICPFTDPAWTPLLRIAAGVVTETGGVLSHAAIVAREHQIPAVLGVPRAMTLIDDGAVITIDGTAGTVTISTSEPAAPAR